MIRVELTKRPLPSRTLSMLSPLIALGLTIIAGSIMFMILGKNPAAALYSYFIEPLTEIWSLHELAIKAAPLILIAVGLAVCYRANVWNIGAEGQFTFGAILGSMLPVLAPGFTGPLLLPLMLLMGIAGGMAWAAIPAFLRVRFGTNEILTSLMLVYVAGLFLDWLVRGPWRSPKGFNFPETIQFSPDALLPAIWYESGRAHWGFAFAIAAAILAWFMLERTVKGFELRLMGQAPRAGRFAGFSTGKTIFFAFLVSGAAAGLAGISEVSGAIGQLRPVISPGYGFAAIIVAFLGRLNPLGIIAAGLVLALSYLGGEAAQISMGISDKAARVFQGFLLFFVLASDTLIHYKIKVSNSKHEAAHV